MEEQQRRKLYAPDWQLRAKMTWANELYVVAPRGTGKTEEILAQRAIECVQAMPKVVNCFQIRSFALLVTTATSSHIPLA